MPEQGTCHRAVGIVKISGKYFSQEAGVDSDKMLIIMSWVIGLSVVLGILLFLFKT